MGIATGLTAARMQEIVDAQYASGAVDLSGHLIFTRNDGSTVDVGQVKGDKGDPAVYSLGSFTNPAVDNYIRIATLDGIDATTGASMQFFMSNIGGVGTQARGTILVHVTQRGADSINVKAWSWGMDTVAAGSFVLYTRKLGTYLYEVWAKFGPYNVSPSLNLIGNWKGALNLDNKQTAVPGGLTNAPYSLSGASYATDVIPGTVELATNAEAMSTTDQARVITPGNLAYVQDNSVVRAVLDPLFAGSGGARVRFLSGGGLSTEYYDWETPYVPSGNRVVNMRRRGGTWVISGHNAEGGLGGKFNLEPFLANGWTPYNLRNALPQNRWSWPRAQRLMSGIVVLSGLIGYGTATAGTTVLTLPDGYRPDTDMIFPINNGDTAKVVTIRANGSVQVEGANWTANTYISLDGIMFPAAGVATWTAIGAAGSGSSFANTWTDYANPASWGVARYWKDPYGFVWFAGLVKSPTAVVDGVVIANLPATHRAHLQQHIRAGSANVYGCVGADAANGLNAKANSSNAWISLGGVVLTTTDALTLNSWKDIPLAGAWVQGGAGFPTIQSTRREDGLILTKGLVRGGTAPPLKLMVPRAEYGPTGEAIIYVATNSAMGRADIRSRDWASDDERGSFYFQTGSTAWLSLDGLTWMPGD